VIVVMSGFNSDDSNLFEYMTSVAWDLIVGLSFVQFFCFCFCFCFFVNILVIISLLSCIIICIIIYKLSTMQPPTCLIEECPNPPLDHGLCSDHSGIPLGLHHPMSGRRHGVDVTMAGQFFNSLSLRQRQGVEKLEEVMPVVRVPFIRDEATFRYTGRSDTEHFEIDVKTLKQPLRLRDELLEGIREQRILDKPIVFLVATNIPHTGIYILYGGQFYSVAYGYDTDPAFGSLYSIDIPLVMFAEARIAWIGILTDAIAERLQREFDLVTQIGCNVEGGAVDRLMFFHTPREYGGAAADASATHWNCTKWAMHVLFGDQMPANFRDLVSRTNPGLTRDQLVRMLTAYRGSNDHEFMRVLNEINHASFPRVSMGGRRRRITNNRNRNRMKRKIMKKTRKTRK